MTELPSGYRESVTRGVRLVAREDMHETFGASLRDSTLHAWAAAQPGARALQGRGVAWAVRVGVTSVVVRHSRHGGLLAPITGDVFVSPSRAPRELAVASQLAAAGVPTPAVLAFATYVAAGPLCRADVVTAYVDGVDLPAAWQSADAAGRDAILAAVAELVARMRVAGAVHEDFNVKNVLVTGAGAAREAVLLDVDRVVFVPPGHPGGTRRNLARLQRSVAKWRERHGLDVDAAAWERLAGAAMAGVTP
jgi:3-deoxy-D-manno-octulosonic acid kinase